MATEQLKALSKDFFTKMCIDFTELTLEEQSESIYQVKILTPDSGIIIGQQGKNLEDIKMILRLIFSRTLGKNITLHLEINDYLESKDRRLFEMVQSKIDYIKKIGGEIKLPELSSYERKKIHSYVSELNDDKMYTRSEGEGNERRLFVGKKQESMTIDIDATDI